MDFGTACSASQAEPLSPGCSPVAILLVTSGSKGDQLIFKYPDLHPHNCVSVGPANPYEIVIGEDYGLKRAYERPFEENRMRSFLTQQPKEGSSSVNSSSSVMLGDGLSDRLLAALLAVKIDLCGKPLLLHVNDVIFASHPTLLTDVDAIPPYSEHDILRHERAREKLVAATTSTKVDDKSSDDSYLLATTTSTTTRTNSTEDEDFAEDNEHYDIERALMTSAQLDEHYRSHFKHALTTTSIMPTTSTVAVTTAPASAATAGVSSSSSPSHHQQRAPALPTANSSASADAGGGASIVKSVAAAAAPVAKPVPPSAPAPTPSSMALRHAAIERRSINMFNVVFVLPASSPAVAVPVTNAYIRAYQQLSRRIALVLWQEEKRSSFLTNQVKVLLACKELIASTMIQSNTAATQLSTTTSTAADTAVSSAAAVGSSASNAGVPNSVMPSAQHSNVASNANSATTAAVAPTSLKISAAHHSACCELQLRKSILARTLRKMFQQACDTGIIADYSWTLLSFCLLPKVHCLPTLTDTALNRVCRNIMPYHSAVLLLPVQSLLRQQQLPPDAAPTYDRVVQAMSPIKSFERIAADADVSLRHVIELAAHLVYWRRARIITPISETNRYIVAPGADLRRNSPLTVEFQSTFLDYFPSNSTATVSPITLHHVLEVISTGMPLSDLYSYAGDMAGMEAANESLTSSSSRASSSLVGDGEFNDSFNSALGGGGSSSSSMLFARSLMNAQQLVDIVTWLLQKRLIVQIHMFIVFVGHEPLASREPPSTTKRNRPLPSNRNLELLSSVDRKRVENIPAAREEDFRIFQKLLPYCNGSSPIEDMMYWENLPRAKILHMLERFCDVLATCWHQDFRFLLLE